MKLKALKEFRDLVEKKDRSIGEVFEVSDERAEKIMTALPNWVEVLGEKPAKGAKPKKQAQE